MPYIKERHDIGILRQDGTTSVGLMLARDSKDIPYYQVDDDEYLAQQQTNTPGYDGLPYEKEIRLSQDDWSGGFGQEIYDAAEPNKYLESSGVDARAPHQLLGGGYLGTIAYPVIPSVTNGTFETGDLTGWTTNVTNASTAAASGVQKHAGSWSALLTLDNTASTCELYQQIACTTIVGSTIIVKAWAYTNVAATGYIKVTDSAGGSTASTAHTGSSAWEQLTVSHKITAASTWIRVYCYVASAGAPRTVYFDDAAISTAYGVGTPYGIEDFNSAIYFAAGQCLMKINSAGTCTLIKDMGATITCLKKFTDGNLYIALGLSTAYQYMATAETFTVSNAVVNTFQYFEQLDATSPTLYGNSTVNTVRSTTNPANGGVAWSAVTTIDTTEWVITCIRQAANQLYILKGNRPYYLDTSGNVKILTTVTDAIASNTTGGINTCEWQGKLYMPYGYQGLLEYDISNGSFDFKQPSTFGQIYQFNLGAINGDDGYLYAIEMLAAGGTVTHYAGSYVSSDNGSRFVWHQIKNATLAGTVYASLISNITGYKRQYFTTSNTANIYYFTIPAYYGRLKNDIGHSRLSGVTLTTAWLHGEFKADTKAFVSMTLVMGHTYNASRYWTVEYQLVGDSAWTSLGNFTGSATSMTETKFFSTTSKPKSTMIRFRFTSVTNFTLQEGPILNSFSCKALLYPTRRNIIKCVIRGADEIIDKDGMKLQGNAKLIRDTLLEAKNTATFPVTFYDINGDTKYVKVLPAAPFSRIIRNEKTKNLEEWFYCSFQEVSFA